MANDGLEFDDGVTRSENAASEDDAKYNPNEQRARVREKVRMFEQTVVARWTETPPLPEGTKHNSTLDHLMKHKSLNAFRFRWFAQATSVPVIWIIGSLTILYVLASLGPLSDGTNLFQEYFNEACWLLSGFLLIIAWQLYGRYSANLENEGVQFNAAIREQALQIDVLITNQLNQESAIVSENAAKIRAVVADQDDRRSVSEGLKATMRSWRRLERLPYYLRHAWDEYYNGVKEHREVLSGPRILKYVGAYAYISLIAIWALYDAVINLLNFSNVFDSYYMTLTFAWLNLPLSQVMLVISLTVFYIWFYNYRRKEKKEHFYWVLMTCAVMVIFIAVMALTTFFDSWVAGAANEPMTATTNTAAADPSAVTEAASEDDQRSVLLLSHASLLICLTVAMGLYFAYRAQKSFKQTADLAPARIVDALKTHKKSSVLEMFGYATAEDYRKVLTGQSDPGPVWGGWTDLYEAEKRAALIANGETDPYEIAVEIAVDPAIYVGEDQNRRIQVAQFDPTQAFLNAIPELRASGI